MESYIFDDHGLGNYELSVHYDSPITAHFESVGFKTYQNQHFYIQAAKYMAYPEILEKLSNGVNVIDDPEGFDLDSWISRRDDVVLRSIVFKFTQHDDLIQVIRFTDGKSIIYKSDDTYLGYNGKDGMNMLGKLLVVFRDDIDMYIGEMYDDEEDDYIWENDDEDDDDYANVMREDYSVIAESERAKTDLRFVVGITEPHKPPGKGVGEIMIQTGRKTSWTKLSRIWNWRRILSDRFEGMRNMDSASFIIDGMSWMTPVHYILGMRYKNHPKFQIKFSLSAIDKGYRDGAWGSVDAAIKLDADNQKSGKYDIDPLFRQNLDRYTYDAYLAKFTQNRHTVSALLETGNAVIAIRDGANKPKDVPIFSDVRAYIRSNPTLIYKGQGNVDVDIHRILTAQHPDELNTYHIGIPKYIDETVIKSIPISENSCIVYVRPGIFDIGLDELIEKFGEPKLVKRHVYSIEQISNNLNWRIFIGIQRVATSQIKTYYSFSPSNDLSMTIYIEQFENGISVFVVSDSVDQRIFDWLKNTFSRIDTDN